MLICRLPQKNQRDEPKALGTAPAGGLKDEPVRPTVSNNVGELHISQRTPAFEEDRRIWFLVMYVDVAE